MAFSLSAPCLTEWLQQTLIAYNSLDNGDKNTVLEALIFSSGPCQLFSLSTKLPELVFRDFITYLPPEIVSCILQYLDGKQLLICCQVSTTWNERINNFASIWRNLAKEAGADVSVVDDDGLNPVFKRRDLKHGEQQVKSCSGKSYKHLYLLTIAMLNGFNTDKSIHIEEEFIDKGTWRITSVTYCKGNIVTGCDDHSVQVWSIPKSTVLKSITTHSVCCLTLTDVHLYTASFNANAESWDFATGRHRETFCGHTSAVLAIDVLPDESFLLTGSVDKTAKLWDLRKTPAQLLQTFAGVHEDWVFQVKFLHSDSECLHFITCDANACISWCMDIAADKMMFSHQVKPEGCSKFSSFYHMPKDPYQIFACEWLEETKSSRLCKYVINSETLYVENTLRIAIPMDTLKAYLLGAGEKFAVIMCSISRKDFHVVDIPGKAVVATIATPDFCMLTRNGSTVTLCDTQWLDGFNFSHMKKNTPVFAASVGRNTVMLGTWALDSWNQDSMKFSESDDSDDMKALDQISKTEKKQEC